MYWLRWYENSSFLFKVKGAEAVPGAAKGNSDSTFLLFKKVRKFSVLLTNTLNLASIYPSAKF